jgi:hypothetical protein
MPASTFRLTLALLLPAAACGRDGGPAFRVRDSSGVEIAESRRPSWPDDKPGLVLSVEPVLQVGAVEGAPEEQLDQVRGVVRLSDGRMAVANGATNEIRFYGPDGRFLLASGRAGQGPGEFERLDGLWRLPGDTLAAYDSQLRRISVFSPAGGFLRSAMAPSPVAAEYPRVTGAFADGTFLLESAKGVGGDAREGTRRDSVHLFRVDMDGAVRDSLGAFPSNDIHVSSGKAGENFWTTVSWLPLGRRSTFAARGEQLVIATADAWEIEVRRPDGRPRRLVRRTVARAPLSRAEIDATLEREAAQIRERDSAFAIRYLENMSQAEWPAFRPAYGRVLAAGDGSLWVAEAGADEAGPQRWEVIAPDGRLLGALTTPARFRPLDVGADYVAGLWHDDLDVTYLRVYRLGRAD